MNVGTLARCARCAFRTCLLKCFFACAQSCASMVACLTPRMTFVPALFCCWWLSTKYALTRGSREWWLPTQYALTRGLHYAGRHGGDNDHIFLPGRIQSEFPKVKPECMFMLNIIKGIFITPRCDDAYSAELLSSDMSSLVAHSAQACPSQAGTTAALHARPTFQTTMRGRKFARCSR
jgi:hypothetical protein